MRIVFIGAVAFSADALRELIAMQAEIVGVCTLSKSSFNNDHIDLTTIASSAGIPAIDAIDINAPETLRAIEEWIPDVIFCFGWSQLIKRPLLDLPPLGVIGFHPAALPANRGRHPLIWALVLGLSETASTFFFMDEGADSGDIISQQTVPISCQDDASSLYQHITKTALSQIRHFLPSLIDGSLKRKTQSKQNVNVWRKRFRTDGQIDWRMAAESIHNLVRGLTHPYVGAHFNFEGNAIKVWRTELEDDVPINIEPGKVLESVSKAPLIKAGIGGIRLLKIEPQVSLKSGIYL